MTSKVNTVEKLKVRFATFKAASDAMNMCGKVSYEKEVQRKPVKRDPISLEVMQVGTHRHNRTLRRRPDRPLAYRVSILPHRENKQEVTNTRQAWAGRMPRHRHSALIKGIVFPAGIGDPPEEAESASSPKSCSPPS